MNTTDVIKLLDEYQTKGAAIEIALKIIPNPKLSDAEKFHAAVDYTKSSEVYYSLYKKEGNLDKKMYYGLCLVQELINASNLDTAEKFLNELENKAKGKEEYMGAIWEKRGWIADGRHTWDMAINYFQKAEAIYKKKPTESLLTVEHFLGRALYFRGRKADLEESYRLFTQNLKSYKKLKSDDSVAFNYSWLARVLIAQGKLKDAKEATAKAEDYFNKASKKHGEQIKTFAFRIKAELALVEGKKDEAIRNSLEAVRLALPSGAYYNGVLEALKPFIKAL